MPGPGACGHNSPATGVKNGIHTWLHPIEFPCRRKKTQAFAVDTATCRRNSIFARDGRIEPMHRRIATIRAGGRLVSEMASCIVPLHPCRHDAGSARWALLPGHY